MSKKDGNYGGGTAWGRVPPRHSSGAKQWTSSRTMMDRTIFGLLGRTKAEYDKAHGADQLASLGKPTDLKFRRFEEPGDFLEKVGGGKYTDILRWTAYDPPTYLLATKERQFSGKNHLREIRLVMAATHGPRLFEDFSQAAGYAHRYEEFLELTAQQPPTLANGGRRPSRRGRIKPPEG